MSEENIEIARRFYEVSWDRDHFTRQLEFLDPEIEFVNPPYAIEPGTRRGYEGWKAAMENAQAAFGTLKQSPFRFLGVDDKVLVSCRTRVKTRLGVEFEREFSHVLTLRAGKITRLQWFQERSEALEAAGVPVASAEAQPLLLVVHSQEAAGRSVERLLRTRFGSEGFEATVVGSAAAARELIDLRRQQGLEVALVCVDFPEPANVELVGQIKQVSPATKIITTVPYADIKVADEAMNEGSLDYFFIRPLAFPEKQMFPVLSDLLDDWKRSHQEKAIEVFGQETSRETHELCDFLARNDIAFHRRDPAHDLAGPQAGDGPVAVLLDGTRLQRPSLTQIADKLGLATAPESAEYDLIVIGGGPAGLGASVYGASEGLSTLMLESYAPGGQAGQSSSIENYLGFPKGVEGGLLAQRALRQARRFGVEIVRLNEAVGLEAGDPERHVLIKDGARLGCRTAVISCGVSYRRLDAPGVDELVGRGVYYGAAVADAQRYEDGEVFIVGGANSAGQAALHFAQHAREVTILVRGKALEDRMSRYLVDRIVAAENISVLTQAKVAAVNGDNCLEQLTLTQEGSADQLAPAQALFIFIGAVPHTDWLAGSLARDEHGFVLAGRDIPDTEPWPLDRPPLPLETSIPGVFAAGDVRHGSVKRVASAVGEGAMAVQLVHQYLAEQAVAAPAAGG
jgi:thioredoxin reductase (NADPH)